MRTHRSNPSLRPRTLDLEAAANFLQISKEELRRRVKKGVVRGAKPGKCWVQDQRRSMASSPRPLSDSGSWGSR